jgi:Dna[CI] antecedent, DciA
MPKYTKKHNGFVKIDKVLPGAAKQHKLENALYKYQAVKNWEKALCNFFTEAQGQTKVLDFKSGVLTVACLSRDLAYEIKLIINRLIYALNQLLGKNLVFAIRVEV